jgi:hypothetical protein
MHLECSTCATKLTPDLEWEPASTQEFEMGEPMVQRGKLTVGNKSFAAEAGLYIANVEDEKNMHLTGDGKRINGCCEYDGCGGPNLLCDKCNTYVATRRNDCWMPHRVIFDPTATRMVP